MLLLLWYRILLLQLKKTRVVPVATHTLFSNKELIIIRFDSEVICMCLAEHAFFARIGARSVAPQRLAYAREPRNAVCSGRGMCITFLLSRQAENLSPRGRTEEEHERASHF